MIRRRTACGSSFAGLSARSETGDPHYRRKGITVSSRPVANPAVSASDVPAGTPSSPACRCRSSGGLASNRSRACGCEITGVDLRQPLDAETLAEVMKAFEQFLVIVFPRSGSDAGTAQGLLALFRRVDRTAAGANLCRPSRHAGSPPRSARAGKRGALVRAFPHRQPVPAHAAKCIVMRAGSAAVGRDTAFSNAYLVYEHLSDGMKSCSMGFRWSIRARISGRRTKSSTPTSGCACAKAHDFTEDQLESIHRRCAFHPETGRKALFATSAYFKRFVGWSEDESRACWPISRAWRSICTTIAASSGRRTR
ncbi:TauD/TfdA family dioxygenase (plasmid) [Novosphingobium sp. EMRT-2]|nr:TauD/TfdA family dioxygenase [Novosphingobium sp. EMRT-2]